MKDSMGWQRKGLLWGAGWHRILRHRIPSQEAYQSKMLQSPTTASCGVFFLHLVPGLAFIHNITTQIDKNRYMGLRRVLSHMQNNSVLTENQTREEGK